MNTRTLTPFARWALSIGVPVLDWAPLAQPSEGELLARAMMLNTAAGRELGDVALAHVLIRCGCLDYLERGCL